MAKKELRINGKKLAWSILHFLIFAGIFFREVGIDSGFEFIIFICLLIFFASRAIVNMEEAFQ